ncbi:hypothetical protein KEM52_003258 [Ascosphaera acerosa]|nr:hypothetical protein KEM52_003258 [Ascosphaera acerosa]
MSMSMTSAASDEAREAFRALLRDFARSPDDFWVLETVPVVVEEAEGGQGGPSGGAPDSAPPETRAGHGGGGDAGDGDGGLLLYVLDSSFNPPTLAHMAMAINAMRGPVGQPHTDRRLLLLLALRNADKPSQPAAPEDRLAMMRLFALELQARLQHGDLAPTDADGRRPPAVQAIDIAVIKHPFFTEKATAIATSAMYRTIHAGPRLQQVYLLGFDTLVRVLDARYYPGRRLEPLAGFFAGGSRILVTPRASEDWGAAEQQRQYVQAIANGSLNMLGGSAEWARDIDVQEPVCGGEADGAVSSTRVRAAARAGTRDVLGRLLSSAVCNYVLRRGLYAA